MKRILRYRLDKLSVEYYIGVVNYNPNAFVKFPALSETIVQYINCVANYSLRDNYNYLGRYPTFSNSYDMNYLAIRL